MARLNNIDKIIKELERQDRLKEFINLTFNYNLQKDDNIEVYVQHINDNDIIYVYQIGSKNRIEFFYKYIESNKTIHKNALLMNGLLLITSIGLGIANVPVLPFLLGTYQIAAGFKNFQCINAQDYYLSLMNMRKQQIVKRNLIEIKKTYQENTDLISALQKGINEGKNLYSDQGILDSVKTLEALQQLKATIIAAKQSQDARIDEAIIGNQMRRR